MVYKIVKYIERNHKFNKEKGIYELIENERFYAKRKGTIFGFGIMLGIIYGILVVDLYH